MEVRRRALKRVLDTDSIYLGTTINAIKAKEVEELLTGLVWRGKLGL